MYDRTLDGKTLLFGNTCALYESDMVMFDHSTGSYWQQVNGRAIAGTMTGKQLTPLSGETTTWSSWKQRFPNTRVLSRETGFERDYDRDLFPNLDHNVSAGKISFPVSPSAHDKRMPTGAVVVTVELDGVRRAYQVDKKQRQIVNDMLGDSSIVVFTSPEGRSGCACRSLVDGRKLDFDVVEGEFKDQQTGSTWNSNGLATAGELAGTQLEPLPVRTAFWFSIITSFPDIEVYSDNPPQQ